jgi:hypothetical protein
MAVMALLYVCLTYLGHAMKRVRLYTLFLVLAILCTTLTLYFRLHSGTWLTVAWLLQAEALFVAGMLADERRFRILGEINFVLVVAWMFYKDYFLADQLTLLGYTFFKRTLIFATVAFVFYLNAIFRRALRHRMSNIHSYYFIFSYAASVIVVLLLFRNWFPGTILSAAVLSSVLGLILMEVGIRNQDPDFRVQGIFFSFFAIFSGLLPLVSPNELYFNHSLIYRIVCEVIVIGLAYFTFARFQLLTRTRIKLQGYEVAASKVSASAAIISVLFLYWEIGPVAPLWLSFAWLILGVAFIEIGIGLRSFFFRAQGLIVTLLSLLWSLYAFWLQPQWFVDARLQAFSFVLVIAGMYYLFVRLGRYATREDSGASGFESFSNWIGGGSALAAFYSVAATLILVLFIRQELLANQALFIAVAWLAVSALLYEAGIRFDKPPLRWQAWMVAWAAFGYALLQNLVPGRAFGPVSERLVTLGLCIALLYYLYERIYRGYQKAERWAESPRDGIILSWLGCILLMLLIEREIWAH